ncbi:MAG: ABC transporter ATP-binding protein [Acidaminococcaceae bacterium]|nr:ABC transporter ATP-binding protein [Acidaminococcaceae bacterium]
MERQQKEPAVVLKNISKTFRIPLESNSGIKQKLVNTLKGRSGYREFTSLKDISFTVNKGDFFGIVGRNGSGKSTLLKTIAGIYEPNSGSVKVYGSLVPFIELGVGFNPELTGRENVYLNGALLGFSRDEIGQMYDDIVDFAELRDFMEERLKNYSSGMQVRLAFSIAIKARGDILLLDEVLAVGDEAFQRKCEKYFAEIKKQKKTVILVTHNMENVRKYCSGAILIQDGEIKMLDDPNKVADEYYGINLLQGDNKSMDEKKPQLSAKIVSNRLLHPKDTLEMEIRYKALNNKPIFAKAYIDLNGQAIMATNPKLLGWKEMITSDTKEHVIKYSLQLKDFNKGEYKVIALLEDLKTGVNITSYGYDGETIIKIDNPDKSSSGGVFANQARINLQK